MNTIFKVGDKVYHHNYGWGEVIKTDYKNTCEVYVSFRKRIFLFTEEGKLNIIDDFPSLSFTKYDLVNGGFSQKRPLPNIKRDQLIYVRMCKNREWCMRYFSHFDKNGLVSCFNDQKKSTNADCATTWNFYSIENPLL